MASASGSIAAGLFGWTLLYLGSLAWIAPVGWFFVSSSLLSKVRRTNVGPKDHVRNGIQVLANGGVGWLLLLLYSVTQNPIYFAGFVGSFAAATADTWGTEVGRLVGSTTRSVITWQPVEKGESGGISWQGTLGGTMGGITVACAVFLFDSLDSSSAGAQLVLGIAVAGVLGSLADSILGATIQARYIDPETGLVVEEKPDSTTQLHSGISYLTNDAVNVLCVGTGALVAMWWYNFFNRSRKQNIRP